MIVRAEAGVTERKSWRAGLCRVFTSGCKAVIVDFHINVGKQRHFQGQGAMARAVVLQYIPRF